MSRRGTSGDGSVAPPYVTVNENFEAGKTADPKTGKVVHYKKPSTKEVVAWQIGEAMKQRRKVDQGRDDVFSKIFIVKFIFTALISISAGGTVYKWAVANSDGAYGPILWTGVAMATIGPWFALFLMHHLEEGTFVGASKGIAKMMIVFVAVEEFMAIYGSRNPDFLNILMTQLQAPLVIGFSLGVFALTYLRSDKKRNRDLAHTMHHIEDLQAKNETNEQEMKAKEQRRKFTIHRMGTIAGDKSRAFMAGILVWPFSIFRNIGYAWREAWRSTAPGARMKDAGKPEAKKSSKATGKK